MIRKTKVLKILLFSLLILSACPLRGAMTATGIMDKVVSALNSAPSLNFKMNIQSGSNGSFTAYLTMSREKFKYELRGMTVFFDGTTQWTVDKDSKEVSITEPTADELAETNPLAFVNNYKKNYKVSYVSESNGTYTVKLTALKKASYVRSAQVVVSGTTWLPTHITAKLSSGQDITILVTTATKGQTLPSSQFKYDKTQTPDFEMIDLR